ncbi:Uncharacterized protein FWK35_00034662 [Aphis craccivora]|uniref:Reverse transcriptase domain-containing protein n=1 Tax=Aphis craccivora TaxID=307492 RepID=A0A6G0VQZ5_APHCR|nr:Uncharacterized protein FWK35_00034662 [Aphis craccivora]
MSPLKSRNNVMAKLASTTWGCHNNVLRTTALALVYNVAKYCAPVWAICAHCAKIDVQLNHTMMRIISGKLRSTPTIWLPTLSNKAPPDLRILSHTTKILHKLKTKPVLPLQIDILEHPPLRLKSRAPIWNAETQSESRPDKEPFKKVPGWDTTRAIWTTLNRIRSEQGICNYLLHKWGMVDSPLCECGETQTIKHMVESCSITMIKEGLTKLHEGGPTAIK